MKLGPTAGSSGTFAPLCLAVLTAFSSCAWGADLTVIHDGPGSVPVGTYFGHLVAGVEQRGVLPGTRFPLVSRLKAELSPNPTELGQGLFDSKWLAHPIFVLGTDLLSFQWLQLHRQTLIELGASGLVVAAPGEVDFKDLQAFAGGLSLAPARGDWLEKKLLSVGIKTYPLVVMPDGRISNTPAPAAIGATR